MTDEKKSLDQQVEEQIQKDIDAAWKALLETQSGRLVLWSILELSALQNFAFYGNSHDALHKGRQQVGAEILDKFVYPNGIRIYTDMLIEAEAREKRLIDAIEHVDKKIEENDYE